MSLIQALRGARLLPLTVLALSFAARAEAAAPVGPTANAADSFRSLCVANGARIEPVVAAAKAAGFVPPEMVPQAPAEISRLVVLERRDATSHQVVTVATGQSPVANVIAAKVPIRSCGVSDESGGWDARAFARQLIGVEPLLDTDGTTVFSYFERPTGNAPASDKDLPRFVAGINAGELRTLAVMQRGTARSLSWVVFETPPTPLTAPAHDKDPFAPCRWEDAGKASTAPRRLSCPDSEGKFRTATTRSLTEATPTEAENGDATAMLRLASLYADGPTPLRDPTTAFGWAKRAADAGRAEGAFDLGVAYEAGIGVAVDKAAAAHWYRAASDRNFAPAMINLAGLALTNPGVAGTPDPAAAAALVRRVAETGSTDGMFDMGRLSEIGIGVAKDMTEALHWYQRAADAKDSRAMLRLAMIYADGISGVPRDDAAAVRLMMESTAPAMRIGASIAALQGLIYRYDDPKRLAPAEQAAATDPAMALQIGLFLADPTRPTHNAADALRLLRIAADAHIPLAAIRIAMMYATGEGVPKDDAEALKWFRFNPQIAEVAAFRRTTRLFEVPVS